MIPTATFVLEKFNRFNTEIFGGKLPPLPIRIGKARTSIGSISHKKGCGDYKLTVSACYDMPETDWEDVIIHEMIHYHILYFKIKDTSAHGRAFRRMMDDINTKFNRHISISRRGDKKVSSNKAHYVFTARHKNGSLVMASVALSRLSSFWRLFPKMYQVVDVKWYLSYDSFFDILPKSVKPKAYIVKEEALSHLEGAREIVLVNGEFVLKRVE